MKKSNLLSILSLVLVSVFTFGTPAYAQSVFLGDFCFRFDVDADDEFFTYKLGASDIGNSHIQLQGIDISDGAPVPEGAIVNGNGEIVGGELVFMLNSIYNDSDEIGIGTIYARLSLETLSGTFAALGSGFDKQSEDIGSVGLTGTLAPEACP